MRTFASSQYRAPMNAPMDVPPTASMGMPMNINQPFDASEVQTCFFNGRNRADVR
jgi:hypothetical protein